MKTKVLSEKQKDAIEFIQAKRRCGVFADMGVGKTTITLHALLKLPKPVLLVGPIRVIEDVWEEEAQEWPAVSHFTFKLLRGRSRLNRLLEDADIYLINPDSLQWLFKTGLYPVFKTLVVDESSMFKDASTRRFKQLRRHLTEFPNRIILTGTPSPNGLLNLWSQIFILDRGSRLEESMHFYENRYFEEEDYYGRKLVPVPGARKAILKRISDVIYRIESERKEKPTVNPVYFNLPPKAEKIYKEMEKEAFTVVNQKSVTTQIIVSAMMKCRQIASGFVYDDDREVQMVHKEKLDALEEVIEGTGSPVMVIYQFKHELAALRQRFPDSRVYKNFKDRDDWNAGLIPVMFLNPASASHGLNLQRGPGHTIAVFSASFSQEQMSQAFARIDRQGQKHQVFIHWLLARNTIDELLKAVVESKSFNQSTVLRMVKDYAQETYSDRRSRWSREDKPPPETFARPANSPTPYRRAFHKYKRVQRAH